MLYLSQRWEITVTAQSQVFKSSCSESIVSSLFHTNGLISYWNTLSQICPRWHEICFMSDAQIWLKRSFKINVTFSNPKQLPFNTWAKPGDRLLVMSLFMLCLNDVWKSDRGSLPPSLRAPTTNCFYLLKWEIIHTCRPVRLNAVFKVAVQKHTSTDYRLWLFHKLLWDQIRPNMKNSLVQSNKHHKTNYGRRFVPLNIEKREETNENEKLTKENLTNHHQHCGKDLCLIQKL